MKSMASYLVRRNAQMVWFFCVMAHMALGGSSPVINRYFPHTSKRGVSSLAPATPLFSVATSAAWASKTFAQVADERAQHRLDGLLELYGEYDLSRLVYSAVSADPAYSVPFYEETGGLAWLDRRLVFEANSSLSMYAATITSQVPVGLHGSCGVELPFMHVEARQRYAFPAEADTRYSFSDREQVQRLRRLLHRDIGLKADDWQVDGLGDATVWVGYQRTWDYCLTLRRAQLGGRISCGIPSGRLSDDAYAASVPFGSRGHWAIGANFEPAAELKEGIFVHLPLSLVWQCPRTHVTRMPVFNEPVLFSALRGAVKISPGLSFRCEPSLTFAHVYGIDNLHFSLGFAYVRHLADTWEDVRTNQEVVSYLTRTTVPGGGAATLEKVREINEEIRSEKKESSSWSAGHLVFDLTYELKELFSRRMRAPRIRAVYETSFTGYRSARTDQISLQFTWCF